MLAGYLEARNQITTGMAMTGLKGEGLPMSHRKRTSGRQSILADKG